MKPSSPRILSSTSSLRKMTTPPSSSPPRFIPNSKIRTFREIPDLRAWRTSLLRTQTPSLRTPSDGTPSLALVPTMGALHEGHLALVRAAARENTHVLVSIFVNPAQFGAHEDLATYPQTWDADCAALAKLDEELRIPSSPQGGSSISAVFAPPTSALYPSGPPGQLPSSKGSFVSITPVSEVLEGSSRPTFFRGVATVCMKLFNIVQPDRVYFGQKDVQQTVVIRKMVKDFCIPTEVVVEPTVRETDGLAMSSRNVYLGPRRRRRATVLFEALRAAERVYGSGVEQDGVVDAVAVRGAANEVFARAQEVEAQKEPGERVQFEVDYLALSDPDTMLEVEEVDPAKGAILSTAVKMLPVEEPQEGEDLGEAGGPTVRLLDNVILPPFQAR